MSAQYMENLRIKTKKFKLYEQSLISLANLLVLTKAWSIA